MLFLIASHPHRVAEFMFLLQKLAPDVCDKVIAEAVLHPKTSDYVEGYRYTHTSVQRNDMNTDD